MNINFTSAFGSKNGAFTPVLKIPQSVKHLENNLECDIFTVKEFKYRKSGSSLAFDVYKLPDLISNTIFKLGKALIADDKQRHIYSEGYNQTLNFLKSAAKTVK